MNLRNLDHFEGGNLKTAAKLLVLEWYLEQYVNIMKNQWDSPIWYVDTHAGSGLTRCSTGVHIDGSALRVLENHGGFDRFYFYELNPTYFESLYKTIGQRLNVEFEVTPARVPGEDFMVARSSDPYIKIMNLNSNRGVSALAEMANTDSHWFTFIDPAGLTAEKSTLNTLIERGNMDILINYQTAGVRRNAAQGAVHAHGKVDETLGSGGWPLDATDEELVSLFVERLEEHPEWTVRSKDMTDPRDSSHRFDLVFASSNATAHKIMNYIMDERDDLWSEASKELEGSNLDDFGF